MSYYLTDMQCLNCKKEFKENGEIGTKNRNHCPYCLYSLHLDDKVPGDRKSKCKALMEPISLRLKNDKVDKYGNVKKGELMIVHRCVVCGHESMNRIAGDDNPESILDIPHSKRIEREIKRQIFGE